ncbi:unnamed protein product [Gongylonema pulchrum]|uniref:Cu2_monoox_C domain-containing protein n=1 Tax=Gongylonema pulchrum TaxID=637853 RepID=A0A183EFL6_9BILA|nr:unnamed protein product [Gongylonema pulchrum]
MAGNLRPRSPRITRTVLSPQFLFLEVDNGWWCDDWAKPDDTSRGILRHPGGVFTFALVYNFPRTGGTVQCHDRIFKYTPPVIPDDVMRIRVYLALPYDFWNQ